VAFYLLLNYPLSIVIIAYFTFFANVSISIRICLNTNYKSVFNLNVMHHIILISLSIALSLQAFAQTNDRGYIVKVGDALPALNMTLTDGTQVSPDHLKGKVVLIQFTASWCGVCRNEMPHLEKDVWLKYKDHPDFFMVGVDLDEPLEKVISFGETVGITYPLALDPGGKLFYQFAAQNSGVTRNILSDRDGNIIMLTRLFDQEEFNQMTAKIGKQLE
jgi:thiol-disulfide isomerase/thioredoxin